MFETFYEMSATPFTRGIPSSALYMPPELMEVSNRLSYVAKRRLFAVVTGDCGTGKTTIVRSFKDSLDRNRYKFLYLSDSKLTPRNFYRLLLEQMGFTPKYNRGDAKRQLHEEIEILKAVHGIQPVCVCDEAHLMNREMLEEIRFLLNTHLDSISPLGLILVGQTELWNKLKLQSYAAIRQRIDVISILNHYDRSQTGAYIKTQLNFAGTQNDIFTEAAIDEIHQHTAGTARMIDKVCTSLLLYASQSRLRLVDDHAARLVLECEFT
ncbi:ExeA family protein [Faecalicatena contorta]|uniref:Type II secretory pathway, component ExeA (Predicted ATPase) n=1 Tax=Faecalicatena contorta TaxID=39482 RepID=A0A316A1V8_9FIRM|nr:AAA family ATPase [Faecalicatena contorta]PWJ51573.1 type II secretory pathway predicted ATPase ExeA [Faecalicatena contorta]SUQ13129.1 Type II secretory pathway, component ExeA (predicted ATPase) [Faecalicatena contorta]